MDRSIDRGAADMMDLEARSFGHVLRDGLARLNAGQAARCLVAVASLLLVLVTLDPFPDLRNPDISNVVGGRMALTYVSWGLLAAIATIATSCGFPASSGWSARHENLSPLP